MKPNDPYVDWLLQTFEWLVRERGGGARCLATQHLVTPTGEDFPVDGDLGGIDLAEDYFAFVLEHAQVTELRFAVERAEGVDPAAILRNVPHAMTEAPRRTDPAPSVPAGSPLPIPVDLDDLARPQRLIASMARGVAHYYAQATLTPNPGGAASFEYATDVTSAFLGFGVFAANSAKALRQFQDGLLTGWSIWRLGALSEIELSYAFALFSAFHGLDRKPTLEHLEANPRAYVEQALSMWKHRRSDIDALRHIAPDGSPYRSMARGASFPNAAPAEEEAQLATGIECPDCAYIPTSADYWSCHCGCDWHTFLTRGVCPNCHYEWDETACPSCGQLSPHEAWYTDDATS